MVLGLIQFSIHCQRPAQIQLGTGILRIQLDGGGKMSHGFGIVLSFGQDHAQVIVRVCSGGIFRQRILEQSFLGGKHQALR